MKQISMKALRVNAGLTLREVAGALNCTSRTVANWEAYRSYPNAQQLADLAALYKCELSDFFIPAKFTKESN